MNIGRRGWSPTIPLRNGIASTARYAMPCKTLSTIWITRSASDHAHRSIRVCRVKDIEPEPGTSRRALAWLIRSRQKRCSGLRAGYSMSRARMASSGTTCRILPHPSVSALISSLHRIKKSLPFSSVNSFLLHPRRVFRSPAPEPATPSALSSLTIPRRLFTSGPQVCREPSTPIGRLNLTILVLTPSMSPCSWISTPPTYPKVNMQA